jgi:hypothetical protein
MRSTAASLLLSLALGLFAGPHPCHAMARAAGAQRAAAVATSSAAAPAGEADMPCHSMAGHHEVARADGAAAAGSLHEAGAPGAEGAGQPAGTLSAGPAAGRNCCGEKGTPSLCEQACSAVAVLGAAAPAPAPLSLAALPVLPDSRPASSLPFPIDHVPLV